MADADRDSDLGDDGPVVMAKESGSIVSLSRRSSGESCASHEEGDSSDEGACGARAQQHVVRQHHAREIKARDDFESLKSSLHPHLSSLATLAQNTPMPGLGVAGSVGGASAPFSLPMAFPFQPPGAFLPPPAPPAPPPAQPGCSSSSSSSEGSSSWSFEEQYKQVRQLYELSDDPQRKEFLDDLFSFMQKRGTPINRLPIMAKSVLDLYELYNLVIARGGLVEVINKKLWQEIIKGLRLPSSITSAAFTLRTQYMKYLYEYECEKKNLSTRHELDAAIDGNKREGRRTSGQYDTQQALAMNPVHRNGVGVPLPHLQPLSLALGGARLPPPAPPHLAAHELEYRVREYMKLIQQQQRDLRRTGSESPPGVGCVSPRDAALNALDVSRLTLWSLYNNNNHSPPTDPEPQREALNLSESPTGGPTPLILKRELPDREAPPAKRRTPAVSPRAPSPPPTPPHLMQHQHQHGHGQQQQMVNGGQHGAAFKITTRGDAATGDQQLVVSIELNGVTYEGVLFPSAQSSPHNQHHRPMVS